MANKNQKGGAVAGLDVEAIVNRQKADIANLIARRDKIQTEADAQISEINAALKALGQGVKTRRSSGGGAPRGPRGPRDPLGARGRVLQALSGMESGNAQAVADAMVKNGYPQSESLATQVAAQFGKLEGESLITRVERGIYKINPKGDKALKAIVAEAEESDDE
jgi:hypothetical protein